MNVRLKRTPGIYVVGFMGAGKSTVGRHLARTLGWSFFDLDDEIEAAEGLSITGIFAARGDAEFRRIEQQMLRQHVRSIERGRPAVLALGGGAFVQPANRELVANNGIVIWLDCPLEIVKRRIEQATHRPLARDPEELESLYLSRRQAYALADVRVEITGDDPQDAVHSILSNPLFQ